MAKATRQEILNKVLAQVSEKFPAGEGFHYFIEYNSVYGGYRLVKVKDDGGAHYGCFGGNATEARLNYTAMLSKLYTILSCAPVAQRPMEELLKELEFSTEAEYFDYIMESIINGQRRQAKDLITALSKEKKKAAHIYLDGKESYSSETDSAIDEAKALIIELI